MCICLGCCKFFAAFKVKLSLSVNVSPSTWSKTFLREKRHTQEAVGEAEAIAGKAQRGTMQGIYIQKDHNSSLRFRAILDMC